MNSYVCILIQGKKRVLFSCVRKTNIRTRNKSILLMSIIIFSIVSSVLMNEETTESSVRNEEISSINSDKIKDALKGMKNSKSAKLVLEVFR